MKSASSFPAASNHSSNNMLSSARNSLVGGKTDTPCLMNLKLKGKAVNFALESTPIKVLLGTATLSGISGSELLVDFN